MIDASSPIPIHHQLAVLLRSEIDAGRYPEGTRLPTELELCERFSVSRTPARKALNALAEEGVIVRFKRRGSFVAPGWVPPDAHAPRVADPNPNDRGWIELMRSITAGSAPDGAVVPAGWVAELAASGAIAAVETDPDPMEAFWVPDTVRAMWELGEAAMALPIDVALHGLWIRRDALAVIGGRPPTVWGDLRSVALSGRDLMGGVSSAFVMPGGAAGAMSSVAATWLLLAAAGVGFGGAGPSNLEAAGADVFTFLRRLIDTGLMSPDVVAFDTAQVVEELVSGRAVAGIAPADAIDDTERFLFAGFPGSGRAGPETSTLAICRVGVVMVQSDRRPAAEHAMIRRRGDLERTDPGLLASAHAAPVTAHYRVFSRATLRLTEDVISGRSTVEASMRDFRPVAALLAG